MNYGPKIVTNGLVWAFDAADRKSYSGTGSSWRNLGTDTCTGTLNGSPAFTTTKGGEFYFTGASSPATSVTTSTNPVAPSQITVETWVNLETPLNNFDPYTGWICGRESKWRLVYNVNYVGWACASTVNDWGGSPAISANATYEVRGAWHQIVGLYNGAFNLIYVDGILRASSTAQSGNISTTYNNNFIWFDTGAGVMSRAKGYGSILRIYNFGLSASQVLQNFNANRRRFGI